MSLADRLVELRKGKVILSTLRKGDGEEDVELRDGLMQVTTLVAPTAPLIDATAIYYDYLGRDEVFPYEDHPCIKPPWSSAIFGYVNDHGNENLVVMIASPWHEGMGWKTENDLSTADQMLTLITFCGGKDGRGRHWPCFGPIYLTTIAIDAQGTPLDIHWVDILGRIGQNEQEMQILLGDWPRLITLGALNFLNCVNVDIAPKPMSRQQRRKEERQGVRTNIITVTGMSSGGGGGKSDGTAAVPLSSVRGHFAHWGDCCPGVHPPKGMLFGKLTGRYWIPQHARGSAEYGQSRHDYRLKPTTVPPRGG